MWWHLCLLQPRWSTLWDSPVCPQAAHKQLILGDSKGKSPKAWNPDTVQAKWRSVASNPNPWIYDFEYVTSLAWKMRWVAIMNEPHVSLHQVTSVCSLPWRHKLNTYFNRLNVVCDMFHFNFCVSLCPKAFVLPFFYSFPRNILFWTHLQFAGYQLWVGKYGVQLYLAERFIFCRTSVRLIWKPLKIKNTGWPQEKSPILIAVRRIVYLHLITNLWVCRMEHPIDIKRV